MLTASVPQRHGSALSCMAAATILCFIILTCSVRGYSHGELGACRRYLEAAAEVRVNRRKMGQGGGGRWPHRALLVVGQVSHVACSQVPAAVRLIVLQD